MGCDVAVAIAVVEVAVAVVAVAVVAVAFAVVGAISGAGVDDGDDVDGAVAAVDADGAVVAVDSVAVVDAGPRCRESVSWYPRVFHQQDQPSGH